MRVAFVALLLMCSQAFAATDVQCLRYMLWREARGEGLITQRAVLDVALNRVKKEGGGACKVLRRKGQYPYMKHGIKPVDFNGHLMHNTVTKMQNVLSDDYFYFGTRKHPWCVAPKKIGNLIFCK